MEIEYFIEEPEKDDDWLNYFTYWENKIKNGLNF